MRELCTNCEAETGRAGRGEDSLYAGDFGPYCEDCWDQLREELAEDVKRLTAALKTARAVKAKPLVWEGNIAQNGMGGRYVISWYDAGDLCTQLTFHSFGNPPVQEYVTGEVFVDTLKAAAQADHDARVDSLIPKEGDA